MSKGDTNLQKPKYAIHFIYASAIVIAVVALIGYDVLNKDQAAHCIEATAKSLDTQWAHLCKTNAKRIRTELKNCIDEGEARARLIYTTSEELINADKENLASCKNIYGEANPNSDCLLPKTLADSVNNDYEKGVRLCKSLS
jgi:hypothetical protein